MTAKQTAKITILPELRQFISPLDSEALLQLEKNIIVNGCRDALIIWQKGTKEILVDGHHRFDICSRHSIPFATTKHKFDSIGQVKQWMIDNQLGRRNLRGDQLSYYRGLKYLSQKQSRGGYQKVLSRGSKSLETSEILAQEFGVSDSTIKRDAKFAIGLDLIGKSNPRLRKEILNGEIKVKKSDVQIFAEAQPNIRVQNVKDLKYKVEMLRKNLLDDVSHSVEKMAKEQDDKEPLFLEKDQQVARIKGKILSILNEAIKEEKPEVLIEVKKMIERLEVLLS